MFRPVSGGDSGVHISAVVITNEPLRHEWADPCSLRR
jgi:hypothetical protein